MEVKFCRYCSTTKSIGDFAFRGKDKTRKQAYCTECMKIFRKNHYHNNKEQYVLRSRKYKKKIIKKYIDWLSTKSCVDCGESDVVVLECDHVRGKKDGQISSMIRLVSWSKILEELKKCEIRCANCHRRKTAKQLNWTKYSYFPLIDQ